MLTLVNEEKRETIETKNKKTDNDSNVVSFASRVKSDKKSQLNVLAAAKKLKW